MTTSAEVLGLLIARTARVMGVDAATVSSASRFDEDLHADSLDLVEVMEGMDRDLRARGQQVGLSDAQLLGLRTVGEAAEGIAASTSGQGEAGRR